MISPDELNLLQKPFVDMRDRPVKSLLSSWSCDIKLCENVPRLPAISLVSVYLPQHRLKIKIKN